MKLAAVRLFVEDLAAARSFYADLLGLKPVSLEPSVLLFDVGPLLIVEHAADVDVGDPTVLARGLPRFGVDVRSRDEGDVVQCLVPGDVSPTGDPTDADDADLQGLGQDNPAPSVAS